MGLLQSSAVLYLQHSASPDSRWYSAYDCWEIFKEEWFLLEPVIREMARQRGDTTTEDSTNLWNTTTEEHTSKRRGLVACCADNITEDVACCMETFCTLTKPYAKMYKYRTA